jgi:hypothetical protein
MTTWKISECERDITTGGIITACWRASTSETVGSGDDAENYGSSHYGMCGFSPDPSDTAFVLYGEVSEEMVLGWVWAHESVDKDAIEANLAAALQLQKEPDNATGTPW